MSRFAVALAVAAACLVPAVSSAVPAGSSPPLVGRISFDDGWRFLKGDAPGAERPGYDDSGWRKVDLPHDWAIEGPFAERNGPSQGGLPFFGTGWYRKTFTLPFTDPTRGVSRRVWLEFDGAMANATVWLNGQELGQHKYGYTGFGIDLSGYLRHDEKPNVLAVRLAPEPESSRWYPGAGIYRHVWLDVSSAAVHLARWGTVVTTPQVSDDKAIVRVTTAIENQYVGPLTVGVQVALVAPDGREVARSEPERLPVPRACHPAWARDRCPGLRGSGAFAVGRRYPFPLPRHRDP